MITKQMIEQAKKRGIDVSWAEGMLAPVRATGGVERLSPSAQQLMDAVRQAQARTPVYIPFPEGTPTQQRRQAEEQKRQFDIEQAFREKQFAADKAYRQAQLELQKAAKQATDVQNQQLLGLFNQLSTQTERQNAATANYQRIVQNAIAGGESLENIAKDIIDASPEMQADGVNPADILRFAVGHFEQQYGSQRWQPGMTMDIKWFKNYKWYLDNKDKLLKQADTLERQFKPITVTGAEALTKEERQRVAEILGVPESDIDLYIKTDPVLIRQLLSKRYGGGSEEDIYSYRP